MTAVSSFPMRHIYLITRPEPIRVGGPFPVPEKCMPVLLHASSIFFPVGKTFVISSYTLVALLYIVL